MSPPIRLSTGVWDAVARHAAEAWPEECCGLLISDGTTIVECALARNVASDRRRRFLIAPEDHFAAMRTARSTNRVVVGAYHSHPEGEPRPSATDRAEAVEDPEFVHVIARPASRAGGGREAELAAYRFIGGKFVPVPIVRVSPEDET